MDKIRGDTMTWQEMESHWQRIWEKSHTFDAEPNDQPKKTITVAYPYPNSPQHIGHGRTYTLADVNARFWRMRGYNVLFPMGFHYTGTPILGMAKRVQNRDAELLDGLRDTFGVPQEAIESFVEPLNIANYFRDEIKTGMMEMGYSIDWRREFTTIDESYKKFIEWQITSLRDKNLIIQGSHPVGWCPEDQNPVSQHDTLGDVEPDFVEYVLARFTWKGHILPTATLRPETIFGVTNLWVNPNVTYDIILRNNERWIVSKECSAKLRFQGSDVEKVGNIQGRDLVDQIVKTPLGTDIPILPAQFAKPDTGTGLVMSVPAHAPFDYMALYDISDSYDISPIPVIVVSGYGDAPARDVCQRLGIKDQNDSKLEEATSEIYNKEFYTGRLLDRCGRFAGRIVSECKDDIRDWMQEEHNSEIFRELSGEVRCRCGALCVVKTLTNQWFLNYGDHTWKQKTKECLGEMDILPDEISGEFNNVVDWLRERACARQHGMGTNLPWDDDWIVESLSDSTIYMAFYIIMKFVNNGIITPNSMSQDFFNYVFYGEEKGHITSQMREIRNEFLYYYPVDTRHSGRDLVPNHLTFFVMNHVVLFPKIHWPRQIVVNGSVLMNGKKMSKSMGNIVPLRSAIKKYGADPIRLGIIISAELLQDSDMNLESVVNIGDRLKRMMQECQEIRPAPQSYEIHEDRWIYAKLDQIVNRVTHNIEVMRLREALHDILYTLEQDMQWYRRRLLARGRSAPPGVMYHIFETRALLLAPFAPHVAEQMWSYLGHDDIISMAAWPEHTGRYNNTVHAEWYLKSVMKDITNIVKVAGIRPSVIWLYVHESAEVYQAVLRCVYNEKTDMRGVMSDISSNPDTTHLRRHPDKIAKYLKDILSEPVDVRRARLDGNTLDEKVILESEIAHVVKTEFDCDIHVYTSDADASNDPGRKARFARSWHPAIFIE